MTCVTNRYDYHYGNARNFCYSHEEAERIARNLCDAELNPRHLPTLMGPLSITRSYVVILRTTEMHIPPCEGCVPEALWWAPLTITPYH